MTKETINASDVIGNSYYIYTLTSTNNTPPLNGTINITCTVTNVYGQAVNGKSITLYLNGTSKGAKTTDSNGSASWNSISMTSEGLNVFNVENTKIEVYVDNKISKSSTTGLVKNDGTIDTSTYLTQLKIGSTTGLPVKTGTNGVLTTGSFGTTSGTFAEGNHTHSGYASSTHTHGNLSDDGKLGTTSGKPVITTTGGAITTGSFGTTANSFCEGNDSRLSDARTPTAHTHTKSQITDFPTIPSKISDLTNDSDFIETSSTTGLVKNDGTIDTTTYLSSLPSHNHDDRYYTETEVDTALGTKLTATKVTSWSQTVSDSNVATEKLVKDTIDDLIGTAIQYITQ